MFQQTIINPQHPAEIIAALDMLKTKLGTQNQEFIDWILELKAYIDSGDWALAQQLLATNANLAAALLRVVALEGRDAAQQAEIDALKVSKSIILPFPCTKGAAVNVVDMFAQALAANGKQAQANTPYTVILTGAGEGEMAVTMLPTVGGLDGAGNPVMVTETVQASSSEMFVLYTDANGTLTTAQYLRNFVQELYEWSLAHFAYFKDLEDARFGQELLLVAAVNQYIANIQAARAASLAKLNGKYQHPFLALFAPFNNTFNNGFQQAGV
jgi:hypothetical protein